ncbi:hypothetical protein M9Y82_04650 [Leptospira weilii]|uniref:Uncharacterized protein n=1 Tax=Leptospira weilii str. Ecochallenge TaxID=1049986 RepID=N1U2Z4_9LEPT|nr:hypothetical protein [Leptospira weilii]EMY12294.1 hypothetical protein LEP1GSC043_3629 [Leptospira weilii str. Ecochallenge]MCL8265950.1 hypothetical protein [Leptospira weilii]
MKQKLSLFIIAFLIQCIADSERTNCRENLGYINTERDALLSILFAQEAKNDPKDEINKPIYFSYYYYLYEKSIQRERKCDNDIILKIFSPESKDLQ